MRDVCDYKHPTEGVPEAQVQSEETYTKFCNAQLVGYEEGETCKGKVVGTVSWRRDDAHLCFSIH